MKVFYYMLLKGKRFRNIAKFENKLHIAKFLIDAHSSSLQWMFCTLAFGHVIVRLSESMLDECLPNEEKQETNNVALYRLSYLPS